MTRSLIILFAILLVSCSPARKYENLPEVKSWEKDIQSFEALDKSESYPSNAILFTGSSSIRLWSTLKNDMAPYSVIQRGFGGSKLSDFIVYANRIVSPHPCSAIVIFIANDITGSEKDKSPAEVASLFSYALKIIRNSHPQTPVFWVEVTPTPSRWKVWPQVKEANRLIKEKCGKLENTYFINTSSSFLNTDGTPKDEFFISDKLHLNADGYKLWTRLIKEEINKKVQYPRVEIIAHRGASYLAPENTVASANLAWKLAADAVECDIYLSSDGKIVVSHDGNTKRTTGENLTIKNTSAADLRRLDAGLWKGEAYKGEKIPFFEEIVSTVPAGKELVVEIKCGPEVLIPLRETIGKASKDIKFTFIAFDFNTIALTKKAFPGNSCYWLCSDSVLLRKNMGQVKETGIEGFSLSYNIITPETASQIVNLGKELFTWTVDDADVAKRMVSLGVKGITTNRPDYIRQQLGY
ncbi:MAG TPA: glycerophosphodiester phosphodiesterase family protein [Bacteroidales bacterium]|nr:glycerophosphodiester phosphodiesterase family protein [Bacteroidales bacterium]